MHQLNCNILQEETWLQEQRKWNKNDDNKTY
jgi:hypothetical protein